MKVKWNQNVSLNIVESYDEEADTTQESSEVFEKDEVTEFDIFEERDNGTVNIQFGNGDVAYGVPKNLFEIVENSD